MHVDNDCRDLKEVAHRSVGVLCRDTNHQHHTTRSIHRHFKSNCFSDARTDRLSHDSRATIVDVMDCHDELSRRVLPHATHCNHYAAGAVDDRLCAKIWPSSTTDVHATQNNGIGLLNARGWWIRNRHKARRDQENLDVAVLRALTDREFNPVVASHAHGYFYADCLRLNVIKNLAHHSSTLRAIGEGVPSDQAQVPGSIVVHALQSYDGAHRTIHRGGDFDSTENETFVFSEHGKRRVGYEDLALLPENLDHLAIHDLCDLQSKNVHTSFAHWHLQTNSVSVVAEDLTYHCRTPRAVWAKVTNDERQLTTFLSGISKITANHKWQRHQAAYLLKHGTLTWEGASCHVRLRATITRILPSSTFAGTSTPQRASESSSLY